MTIDRLFNLKCERIKSLTAEALAQADMFIGFKVHQPTMNYYDTLQAARNLRAAADQLDKLAEKIGPTKLKVVS